MSRSKRRYTLSRVRLVNFHNFVDETIEIRDGGHLFLLGDNGSGKTTVLDAVHLVLSGGAALELNAAARLSGRREEGRSLAGIVLRHDAEKGVLNEGGAVAYAVVELAELRADEPPDHHVGSERLCLGLGMEATTMDARVARWGILRRGPLEALPLLAPGDAGAPPSPTDQRALRQALERHETFGHMTDYRRAIAESLFGGVAAYEEVCRFWSMAKAYREIVASARDFAGLFARLLPAPDTEVFAEILRSMKAIDDLSGGIDQLTAQRDYVAGLGEVTAEIGRRREEVARYRFLGALWAGDEARARSDALEAESAALTARIEGLDASVEAAAARVARSERALRELSRTDEAGFLDRLRSAEVAEEERRAERRQAEATEKESAAEQRRARGALAARLEALADVLANTGARGAEALEEIVDVPGGRPLLRAALEQQRTLADDVRAKGRDPALFSSDLPALEPDVRREQRDAVEAARADEVTRHRAEDAIAQRARDLAEEIARVEALRELGPELPSADAAKDALEAAGLGAEPVYRLVEPRPDANDFALAALEALAGAEVLCALVAPAEDVERVRAIVQSAAPGQRVVKDTVDVALPGWADALLRRPTNDGERRAHAFLAAALSQPEALGAVDPPDTTGGVAIRGAAFRQPSDAARLVGEAARRRARDRRLAERREALAAAEAERREARRNVERARERLSRLEELGLAIDALRDRVVHGAWGESLRASQALSFATDRRAEDARRAEVRRASHAQATALLEGLRVRARAEGTAALERRLTELREEERGAREAHDQLAGERAELVGKRAARAERLEALREEDAARALELARLGEALRAHLDAPMDDAALREYVLVTQRGQQFRTLGGVDERRREAERHEAQREAELEGDGSRGVRNLTWASSFGFSFRREDNRIEDRRGQPLSSVLAELDRSLDEQKSVVNEHTRELMDTLVMGALARHLQERVEHLRDVVRRINRLLSELRFGATRYQFRVTPTAERRELVELVQRISVLDEESRQRFRDFIEERAIDLRVGEGGEVPELLDYRRWFDYRLTMRITGEEDVELTRELRRLGSGGEQGVPNYLLVLALAKLMFDSADARVRPLFFDEAFYGIDAGRRDELLRLATELGLTLLVASPDQDGVTPAVRNATTLFVLKDDQCDVHLAPHHYWNRTGRPQKGLFDEGPDETPAEAARCTTGATVGSG